MTGTHRRIIVIQGHPDRDGHYCHALAERYVSGARSMGHQVELIELASMDIPFVRNAHDFRHGTAPPAVAQTQASLLACDHIVVIHPIWNGGAPARLRAFMEQVFRPAFSFPKADPNAQMSFVSAMRARKALSGKSARVIATMQMRANAPSDEYSATPGNLPHRVMDVLRRSPGFRGSPIGGIWHERCSATFQEGNHEDSHRHRNVRTRTLRRSRGCTDRKRASANPR